jgi:cytochrome bd-type quinol oxidase subunit 2
MNEQQPQSPPQALRTIRVLWFALLLGEVLFLGVIVFLLSTGNAVTSMPAETIQLLFYINSAMLAAAVPLGHFLRRKRYEAARDGDVVTPQGYLSGNILLYAMCEGQALFSLVIVMMAGQYLPYVVPAIVAMTVQVLNWPTGAPMQSAERGFFGREE